MTPPYRDLPLPQADRARILGDRTPSEVFAALLPRKSVSVATLTRTRRGVDRWTGTAWRPVTLPHLASVGCSPEIDTTSPHDAWITTCAERGKEHGLVLHWNGHHWQHIWNLPDDAPLIDGKLGVWLSPTMRWTPGGVGYAALPSEGVAMSFPAVTVVPGTTTLLAVGETWKSSAAHARTYMAIIGGRFGRFRSPMAVTGSNGRAVRLAAPAQTGDASRW